MKDFLVNRDETGREIVTYPETGKKYYVEYIGDPHISWGDINPATKTVSKVTAKAKGSIMPEDSMITKENGFEEIWEGQGSPYAHIDIIHNKWKRENGYGEN
jgi:hypothetical protein